MRDMEEIKNEQVVDFDPTVYDDDLYLGDCKSLKRRLLITEKLILILTAFISVPCGFLIAYGSSSSIKDFLDYLSLPINVTLFVLYWLLGFAFVLLFVFAFKNYSIYKGVIKAFLLNLVFSTGTYLTLCSLSLNEGWIVIAIISAAFYTTITLISIIVLNLIDRFNQKALMIVGPKEDAEKFAKKYLEKKIKRSKIRYVFYEINGEIDDKIYNKVVNVNEIILLDALSVKNKQRFLLYFNSCLNKDVYLCSTYFDVISHSISIKNVNGLLGIEQKPLIIDKVEGAVKRIFDIVCASIILILTSPVFIIIPLLIKLDSKGPVFYRQERYTKGLKKFRIFKFRSMYIDADPNKAADIGDKRITRVGKIIRACRIDEIPQVLNVLKGDMSLVGPRALMHGDVDPILESDRNYKYRFNVKAGITGLQQVKTNPGASYKEKLRYDLYYIVNYSLYLDIEILFETVLTVFKKEMADGVATDERTLQEYLKDNQKEFNQHETYIRILSHKRNYDPETGIIVPLMNPKYSKKAIDEMNRVIRSKEK